jgi:hypothetical protein
LKLIDDQDDIQESVSHWMKVLVKLYDEGFIPAALVAVNAAGDQVQVVATPEVTDIQDLLRYTINSVDASNVQDLDVGFKGH